MVHPITVAVGLGLGIGAILFTLIYGNRFHLGNHEENPHENNGGSGNSSRPRRSNLYEPSSESTCSICLEELDTNRVQLECKHVFHLRCMRQNVRHGNKFCPNCRKGTSFTL